jgi:alpha,alpha-trehalase
MKPDTAAIPFVAIERIDGFLPIERHALIGDAAGSALVAADGTVPWMCVPRFDSEPLYTALLDSERGAKLQAGPEHVVEARQWYLEDSAVVVTEVRTADGVVRLTDALAVHRDADLHQHENHAARAFVRSIEVLSGELDIVLEFVPRHGATFERAERGLAMTWAFDPTMPLRADSDRPLDGPRTVVRLESGERMWFRLSWNPDGPDPDDDPTEMLRRTDEAWRTWAKCISYEGPSDQVVRRSAVTLKLLDHAETGALVAAATSSLPEEIGGVRNWDYRFAWVRDAAFSVHALRRIGMSRESREYLHWVLCAVEKAGKAAVLYDLDGQLPTEEYEDDRLSGYRNSAPVRWGNGAADQTQHDAYGEIVDSAWQWVKASGQPLKRETWDSLRPLIDTAAEVWDTPDHGIWEIRADDRLFTYSVAMCEVALERGAQLARKFDLPGDVKAWEQLADHITATIVDQAWDDDQQALTEMLGEGGGLDASVLALPLRHVIPADHPRMVATTDAVVRGLGSGDGLIHRYDPTVSDDGLPGGEGAFLLCTNWWIDNLILQGRIDEAMEAFEVHCARAGTLGLLPEQIDPPSGAFLGNYPQAFSHVGVLSNAVLLSRHAEAGRVGPEDINGDDE